MMMSLFSMFDPTALFFLPLNWIMMISIILFSPSILWISNSRYNKLITLLFSILHKEYSSLFNSFFMYKGTTLISITLFFFILTINLTSNFPYNFCCSAHLSFSLSLSIPIWLAIIISCWTNLNKSMFSHLTPSGTPPILMPIMVMIELTSTIIRPLALGIRLSANLIAGHLLMTLLGNTLNFNSAYWVIIILVQTIFLSFELMVAMIQSYVFAILMSLYSSEMS